MARDFSSISGSIWMDPGFRRLSTGARLVELYLRTNERCNAVGFYALPIAVGAVEVGMAESEYQEHLADLEASGRVMVDAQAGAILIRRWWANPGNWPHTIKHTAGIMAHERRGRLPQSGPRIWLAWYSEMSEHVEGWLGHVKRAGRPENKRRPGDPDPAAILADAEALAAKAAEMSSRSGGATPETLFQSSTDTPINTPINTPIDTPIKSDTPIDTPIDTPFITGTGTGTSERPPIKRSPSEYVGGLLLGSRPRSSRGRAASPDGDGAQSGDATNLNFSKELQSPAAAPEPVVDAAPEGLEGPEVEAEPVASTAEDDKPDPWTKLCEALRRENVAAWSSLVAYQDYGQEQLWNGRTLTVVLPPGASGRKSKDKRAVDGRARILQHRPTIEKLARVAYGAPVKLVVGIRGEA